MPVSPAELQSLKTQSAQSGIQANPNFLPVYSTPPSGFSGTYRTPEGKDVTVGSSSPTQNQVTPQSQPQTTQPKTNQNPPVNQPTNSAITQPQSDVNKFGSPATGYFSTPQKAAAAANASLQKKYQGMVTAKGNDPVPPTGGGARDEISSYTKDIQAPASDPVATAVNESTAKVLQDYQERNNVEGTMQTVQDYTIQATNALGIPALKTELMNIQNVMNGTEDDIRSEVTSAGGFATESQVEGLASARNKTLLKQASNLQNLLTSQQDTLSMSVSAFGADRANAVSMMNDRIDGDNTALTLFKNIQTQANANYDKLVTNIGYSGLAQTLKAQDPTGQSSKSAESYLGLPSGTLTNPSALKNLETYRQQALSMSQQRLNITIAGNGTAGGSLTDLASAVLNGQLAPSQLPGTGKNSLRAQVEQEVLAENPKFNFESADQQFAFGKNVSTQSTQAALNYTVDTLTQLKSLSEKVDRGNLTFGNQAGQWLKYNGSDPATVAYITKANGAVDDVAAALGGGVSTDAKLLIAKRLLDPTLSQEAFKTQIDTDLGTIASRQQAISGQAGQPKTSNIGGVNFNGTLYPTGHSVGTVQDGNGRSITLTAQADGTLMGSDGNSYDTEGNQL